MLSSHLLDEVEKTCDHVAIVDRGRIVVQGSIAELRDGGRHGLVVEVDDRSRARQIVSAHPAVERIVDDGCELRIDLSDPAAAPELNRRLVEAGLAVLRLEPTRPSLEQRFLEITTRLENAA